MAVREEMPAVKQRRRLTSDQRKPLILIASIAVGIAINRVFDGQLSGGSWVVRIALFAVMFTVMAFVKIGPIGQAFRDPKPTRIAVAVNYVFVPSFAWTLGWLFLRSQPDLWAGVVLYALTPCIGWYLIFIDLAKGDIEWGLALLPIDIALQAILLPLYLWLLIGKVVAVDAIEILTGVTSFLIAPYVAAVLVRRLVTRWRGQEWVNGPYTRAINASKLWTLVAVVVLIFATQSSLDNAQLARVALIVATITSFFIALFFVALACGRGFKLGYEKTATLVFEVTARNSESVIGIAAVILPGRPLVLLAILIGPMIELPVLFALVRIMLQLRSQLTWPAERSAQDNRTDAQLHSVSDRL